MNPMTTANFDDDAHPKFDEEAPGGMRESGETCGALRTHPARSAPAEASLFHAESMIKLQSTLGSMDGDDERKVSRWQLGCASLEVLEREYKTEPFPSLETRRELSRKLNVSARQVQVWFQNKRQRERKLSRAKAMLSTPALPDTPAVAAAHAKLELHSGLSGE